VPRLRRLERGLRGLRVAQLADQDRVGILAERAPQRLAERLGVEPDLALVDDAVVIRMQDLDRVLDCDSCSRSSPRASSSFRSRSRRLRG